MCQGRAEDEERDEDQGVANAVAAMDEGESASSSSSSSCSSPSISFYPFDWRRLCVTLPSAIVLLAIEQSHVKFKMVSKRVPVLAVDGGNPLGDRQRALRHFLSAARAKTARTTGSNDGGDNAAGAAAAGGGGGAAAAARSTNQIDLPPHAVAGLNGELARVYELRGTPSICRPANHCWTADGFVLIGCASGNLIRLHPETCLSSHGFSKGRSSGVEMIFVPPHVRRKLLEEEKEKQRRLSTTRRLSLKGGGASLLNHSLNRRRESHKSRNRRLSSSDVEPLNLSTTSLGPSSLAAKSLVEAGLEGAFRCMLLHGDGLYAGGADGTLRLFRIHAPASASLDAVASSSAPKSLVEVTVETVAHFDRSISSLSASRDFVNLVVGSVDGSVRLFSTKTRKLSTESIFSNSASAVASQPPVPPHPLPHLASSPSSSTSSVAERKFVSLDVLPESGSAAANHLVAVRTSGEVLIVDAASGILKTSVNGLFHFDGEAKVEQQQQQQQHQQQPSHQRLHQQHQSSKKKTIVVVQAVCSPMLPILAVSTSDGYLSIVDLIGNNDNNSAFCPRVVKREKLTHHAESGLHLAFDPTGVILASAGAVDGNVYLINAAPTSGFQVLGCLSLGAETNNLAFTELTAFYNIDNKKIKVVGLLAVGERGGSGGGGTSSSSSSSPVNNVATKLFSIEFSSNLARDPSPFYASESRDFNPTTMNKIVVDLQHPAEGLCLVNTATAFTFSGGHLIRFRLPLSVPAARTKGKCLIGLPTSPPTNGWTYGFALNF